MPTLAKRLETLGLLARAFHAIAQETKALEVYKEMARIAREQGRADLYAQLLTHLRQIAPHDDQVRALDSLRPPSNSSELPQPPSTVSVSDASRC